jgi:hypothetical protein
VRLGDKEMTSVMELCVQVTDEVPRGVIFDGRKGLLHT